jgi:hypothetical protein
MNRRLLLPEWVFRYACLVTAVANLGANVFLVLFYEPVFKALGVPPPADPFLFTIHSALSFTMGFVALLAYLRPDRAIGPLIIGIIGKGLYVVITYSFFALGRVHPVFLVFVAWDALFVLVFFLYWIKLAAPDLLELQLEVLDGIARPAPTRRALLIGFSLTRNGSKALESLKAGMERQGYGVEIAYVVPQEQIFTWPLSFTAFVRICARAFTRAPAKIAPLQVKDRVDWDLVVVESPTWLLGMAAPVESLFFDPANRELFRGRDAAVLVTSRAAYQRTLGMLVRHLERAGANVVAARGYAHAGREPRRLISLWLYLIFRREGFPPLIAEPHYGLSAESLREIQNLGVDLADRSRGRPHWTLLLDEPAPAAPSAEVAHG